MKEQIYIQGIFFAICCRMKKEGYNTISLKNEDLKEYVPKLKEIFSNYSYNSDIFCMTPVEETYDNFKNFIIECLYANYYGSFNQDYNSITIEINDYKIDKILKEQEKYQELINQGYLIMTDQIELSVDITDFDTLIDFLDSELNHSAENSFLPDEECGLIIDDEVPKKYRLF